MCPRAPIRFWLEANVVAIQQFFNDDLISPTAGAGLMAKTLQTCCLIVWIVGKVISQWCTPQTIFKYGRPLKIGLRPKGKDRLPTIIFQGRSIELRGCTRVYNGLYTRDATRGLDGWLHRRLGKEGWLIGVHDRGICFVGKLAAGTVRRFNDWTFPGTVHPPLQKKFLDVSKNRGTPKIIHFNRVFHYKPSILVFPYSLETPFWGGCWISKTLWFRWWFQTCGSSTLAVVPQKNYPMLPYTTSISSVGTCWYISQVLSQGYPTVLFDFRVLCVFLPSTEKWASSFQPPNGGGYDPSFRRVQ